MIEGRIYRQIGIKYGLETIEIKKVCNSAYKFIRQRMNDADPKDILLANLFKFKLKPKYKRQYETTTAED